MKKVEINKKIKKANPKVDFDILKNLLLYYRSVSYFRESLKLLIKIDKIDDSDLHRYINDEISNDSEYMIPKEVVKMIFADLLDIGSYKIIKEEEIWLSDIIDFNLFQKPMWPMLNKCPFIKNEEDCYISEDPIENSILLILKLKERIEKGIIY